MSLRFTISLHRVASGLKRQPSPGTESPTPVTDHLDWFFQQSPDEALPVKTLATSVALAGSTQIEATLLPDHRVRYLDYDGEVSGNRGCVQRLVTGTYETIKTDARQFTIGAVKTSIIDLDDQVEYEPSAAEIQSSLHRLLTTNPHVELLH
ncbi:hypothetical protein [Rhodopirellula sallentina]|uniref:Uncharacterized protein n=1 Tax=Rhodopirellula sallentina SM41 TaxID=1263870 RepID=M5U004_9BACT|nr:hypothetical protein [Rhodopirellula sallentina]EMI54619.1 hypothetical protein RSSM_03946 [Rhodopirellula sallentina SM41]